MADARITELTAQTVLDDDADLVTTVDVSDATMAATGTNKKMTVVNLVTAILARLSPVAVADGGTASTTAAGARTALGVAIGSDVQAHSAVLDATTASFLTADETKLDGIETAATADQTGAQIKVAYEAEADTNAFTDADHSKLDGIETAATADQTGAQIKVAYEAEADTNAFTDADHSKLDGIETAADVTDATNVDAAGALMESATTAEARAELAALEVPQTVTGTTDTLAAADARRLTLYSNAAAVTVTVPTATFDAGDWMLLQSTGAGGLTLSTSGITLNGSSPSVGVAQNEAILIVFTAANTISVIGGTA